MSHKSHKSTTCNSFVVMKTFPYRRSTMPFPIQAFLIALLFSSIASAAIVEHVFNVFTIINLSFFFVFLSKKDNKKSYSSYLLHNFTVYTKLFFLLNIPGLFLFLNPENVIRMHVLKKLCIVENIFLL